MTVLGIDTVAIVPIERIKEANKQLASMRYYRKMTQTLECIIENKDTQYATIEAKYNIVVEYNEYCSKGLVQSKSDLIGVQEKNKSLKLQRNIFGGSSAVLLLLIFLL